MTGHTYRTFDTELERIRSNVLEMGGLVETQVANAVEGLRTGNLALLDQVVDNDHRVNLLERTLDDECNHIIVKRQPAAADLRLVLTVIRMISDLERIGDEAKKMAKAGRRLLAAETTFVPRLNFDHGTSVALDMLRKALDGFARFDASRLAEIKAQDAEVDAEFKGLMRQLITFMMEDPRTITSSLDLLFIAKSIERVGDHAKNIAEFVAFLVEGSDVRHAKSVAAQEAAQKR